MSTVATTVAVSAVAVTPADANGVAVLTLNRPETLNSIDAPMISELRAALASLEADALVKCLVLTGAGRGFCSGADLAQSGTKGDPSTGASVGQIVAYGMEHRWNPMMRQLYDFGKPLVSAVNGVAAGGGVGLALVADVVVASENSAFKLPFGPSLGIVPDLGLTWSLPRLLSRGKYLPLALLGEKLPAVEAERIGLVWKVVPGDALLPTSLEIAKRLGGHSAAAMVGIRHAMDRSCNNTFAQQLELERHEQQRLFDHPDSPFFAASQQFQRPEPDQELPGEGGGKDTASSTVASKL